MLLHRGDFLSYYKEEGWEYVARDNSTGVVTILALTKNNEIVLVEQFRQPFKQNVIELPAGLAGDHYDNQNESFEDAIKRELLEETGYQANTLVKLCEGPVSPGLSTEIFHLYYSNDLEKISEGGGDHTEDILVHTIALKDVDDFIQQCKFQDKLIDIKVLLIMNLLKNT